MLNVVNFDFLASKNKFKNKNTISFWRENHLKTYVKSTDFVGDVRLVRLENWNVQNGYIIHTIIRMTDG